ncbi:MAG: hypothetical protein QNL11_13335 [Desulfobacterales bacterium]|jgi:hypothetical protein|nr:hypothetical protein [Desulfobacterales bacterium]
MGWSTIWFGKKYKGKTLPQVVFKDPDWFFWAMETNAFKGRGKILNEAREIYRKSKSIRIPQEGPEKLVAEYAVHPPTGKFAQMEIIPASRPKHVGSTRTSRSDVIDLSKPRKIARYDKLGCDHLISNLKHYLFGSKSYRMTKARCEAFFEDDDNFDL